MLTTLYARKVYIEMYSPEIRESILIESISNPLTEKTSPNGIFSLRRSKS